MLFRGLIGAGGTGLPPIELTYIGHAEQVVAPSGAAFNTNASISLPSGTGLGDFVFVTIASFTTTFPGLVNELDTARGLGGTRVQCGFVSPDWSNTSRITFTYNTGNGYVVLLQTFAASRPIEEVAQIAGGAISTGGSTLATSGLSVSDPNSKILVVGAMNTSTNISFSMTYNQDGGLQNTRNGIDVGGRARFAGSIFRDKDSGFTDAGTLSWDDGGGTNKVLYSLISLR